MGAGLIKKGNSADPTIAKKFNTTPSSIINQGVIDLLKRVCMVSVETMKIVEEMERVKK